MSEPMNLQATDLEKLNNIFQLQAILKNMFSNIKLIQQGAQGEIITVENANLFQLAAQYYGDAMKWNVIAEANGLVDPVIEATIVITITPQLLLSFSGLPTTNQVITITLTTEDSVNEYSYTTTAIDTLNSILRVFNAKIPGSSIISNDNQLRLPPYQSVSTSVRRILQITIPQTAPESGGILQD